MKRDRLPAVGFMRALLALSLCLLVARAQAFPSAPYFPLPDGATWRFAVASGGTEVRNWQVAGIEDFDGKADVLWRNGGTGENYLYPMNGTAILGTEGYLRTVTDANWQVKGMGDNDGDGKVDVLWRHAVTGENYLYPMEGTTIKPTEGYIRTVPDINWRVVPAPAVVAGGPAA